MFQEDDTGDAEEKREATTESRSDGRPKHEEDRIAFEQRRLEMLKLSLRLEVLKRVIALLMIQRDRDWERGNALLHDIPARLGDLGIDQRQMAKEIKITSDFLIDVIMHIDPDTPLSAIDIRSPTFKLDRFGTLEALGWKWLKLEAGDGFGKAGREAVGKLREVYGVAKVLVAVHRAVQAGKQSREELKRGADDIARHRDELRTAIGEYLGELDEVYYDRILDPLVFAGAENGAVPRRRAAEALKHLSRQLFLAAEKYDRRAHGSWQLSNYFWSACIPAAENIPPSRLKKVFRGEMTATELANEWVEEGWLQK